MYIYGVLLLGLLAGWMLNTPQYRYSPSFLPMLVNPYDEQNWLIEIIDPMSLKEGINQEHLLLLHDCLELHLLYGRRLADNY